MSRRKTINAILDSWWIFLTFIPLCSWISFFWIGYSARKTSWVLFGCVYFALCFVLPVIATSIFELDSLELDVCMWIFFSAWIVSVVHALHSRREYVRMRKVVVANRDLEDLEYIERHLGRASNSDTSSGQYERSVQIPNPAAYTEKIDLNSASEEQLASLPGVSIALAKKAIEMRQTRRFDSVRDFNERLELMPHFAVQINNIAYIEPMSDQEPPERAPGRMVDI